MAFSLTSPEERAQRRAEERARTFSVLANSKLRPITPGTMVGSTSGRAVEKRPAHRLPSLLRLAKDEECCVKRFDGWCNCKPETTVWAHTNTLSDRKGMGYKATDSAGFFAGYECHCAIDQGGLSAERVATLVAAAQERTRARLAEIAAGISVKPWRVQAAQWALDELNARAA